MKNILLLTATALMMGTSVSAQSVAGGKQVDTLWDNSHSYWEIKEPFDENNRRVLYRSCAYVEEPNGNVNEIELSYYLCQQESREYDSILRCMKTATVKKFLDEVSMSNSAFHSITLGNVPRHWFPIRYYKGKPYIIYDKGNNLLISEKVVIPYFGDFWIYQIKGAEKLNDGSYQIVYSNNNTVDTFTMELKDPTIGLYHSNDAVGINSFFTTEAHLDNYDIIFVEGSTLMGINGIEFDK